METTTQQPLEWHSMSEDDLYKALKTDRAGLSNQEAQQRQQRYGLNKLPESKPVSLLSIILHQIINPLILVLCIAAVASLLIGEVNDALFIFLVIFINTSLGAYQEFNAERSASSLKKILIIEALVSRGGEQVTLPSEELVPGDIVHLTSGMKVPADIRLIKCTNLSIDESFLTGESIASVKETSVLQGSLPVAERSNMAFGGSTVMSGRAMGIVVETGVHTEVGKIAIDVSESKSARPPLVLRMESFIKQIGLFFALLSVILAIILRYNGMEYSSIFFFVVALAVSAIPEGLPVALTVALSIATKRMSKRNVIVRKLTSVESLGSCTVIASDKTGTLTVNEQTAKKIVLPDGTVYSISGQGYNDDGDVRCQNGLLVMDSANDVLEHLTLSAVLSTEGHLIKERNNWKYDGDAMDIALLAMSYKLGEDPAGLHAKYPHVGRIPYESENKYSATFYQHNGSVNIAVKGAVETILAMCGSQADIGVTHSLNKELIIKQAEDFASEGYRVLAMAGASCDHFTQKEQYNQNDIPPLIYYGLVCFIDPLRPEAKDAVAMCKHAGITVMMVTGDHPETARTIATELGISDGSTVVTGAQITHIQETNPVALPALIDSSTVFARVSPDQKLLIVNSLIDQDEFVAVTGDGVNDAPALKRANIGVAMGSGTDVAKEVGAMIVLDDNFSSIVAGVEEGRFAYDNVRKVIYLLISTGAAEIVLFLASIIAGLPLPLLAVQLLWLNLVTNGIQDVALACEGGEPQTMNKPPRKTNEKIFNPLMVNQTLVSGSVIGLVTFGLWYYLINIAHMEEFHARNMILLLMVFMENIHVFNCRSETISAFQTPLRRNWLLIGGVVLSQLIHIASMQIPVMQSILNIEPITIMEWLEVLVFALPTLLVMELFKLVRKRISFSKTTS